MHGTDLRLASQTAHKRKSNTLESKQKEIQMEIWIGTDIQIRIRLHWRGINNT